jgi:hypothetical protein
MVQMDGSIHDWFEGREPGCCLMNMADDATNTKLGFFSAQETTEAAMRLLWRWIELYGIPVSIYVDKKTVYVVDEKVRLAAKDEGREVFTQFGRACRKLGIRIIIANSPQAKGRIERGHRVYQDRLVKELRLQDINTIEGVNRLLEKGFLEDLNRRFTVDPVSAADYHRSADGYDLAAIFSIEHERSPSADWIVRFENGFYQLTPPHRSMRGRGKVIVRRHLDHSLHFIFGDKELDWHELPSRPQPAVRKPKRKPSATIMEKYVPPANHPWRLMQVGKGTPLQRS